MVTNEYLDNELVGPVRRRLREEGATEEGKLWRTWNKIWLEAEPGGEFFDGPPPAASFTGTAD